MLRARGLGLRAFQGLGFRDSGLGHRVLKVQGTGPVLGLHTDTHLASEPKGGGGHAVGSQSLGLGDVHGLGFRV